jgi:hypothetical protein
MQHSLGLMVIQLVLVTLLLMIGISLAIFIPAMIYRKGRPERPEIRWTANVCLFLGVLASLVMLDMFRRNGGESGLYALVTIAVSVFYWFCLRHWASRPSTKPKLNPRRVRTHRRRLDMISNR